MNFLAMTGKMSNQIKLTRPRLYCREGGNKRCFCPSVRPSVAYIANNSRTQRPSVPKFGRKVPHLRCDSHSSFKVNCSRSPGPLMLTHIVRHIFRTARHPRSKIKVARSHDQFEPSWPNAVPVSLEASGGILCQPNPAATYTSS